MGDWLKHVLLGHVAHAGFFATLGRSLAVLGVCWMGFGGLSQNATAADGDSKPEPVQVITPEVEPREIAEAKMDDEFFEVGLYAGMLTIDNFGSEFMYGVNAAFHATEDFFLQINYGTATAGETSFEELSGENIRLLTNSERDYTYYNLMLGYNIFPGEVFMTSNLTFNSAFYFAAGVGNTEFGGEDNFTTTLGTGYRIVLRDWLTWHIDFRDHIFQSDVLNKSETTHNVELSSGVTIFF
jgi:outer membrane beta-barrel protein